MIFISLIQTSEKPLAGSFWKGTGGVWLLKVVEVIEWCAALYKVQFITAILTFCKDSDKVTWRVFVFRPYYNANKQVYHLDNCTSRPLHSTG